MNRIILLWIVLIASISTYALPASTCTVTPLPAPGFSPPLDQIPCLITNTAINQTINFRNFKTLTVSGFNISVDTLIIDSIANLPPGMSYFTNVIPAAYAGDSSGCMSIIGTPTGSCGQYKLKIYIKVIVHVGFLGRQVIQGRSDSLTIPLVGGTQSILKAWVQVADSCSPCALLDTVSLLPFKPAKCGIAITPKVSSICAGLDTLYASLGYPSYNWIPSGSTTATNIVSAPGTYIVSGTYKAGCPTSYDTAIVNPAGAGVAKPKITTTPQAPYCTGAAIVLRATPTSYSTYQWIYGGATIGTGNQQLVLAAGQYIIRVTQNGLCGTASDTLSIVINPLPSCSISVNGNILTATATGAGVGYQWYNGNTAITGATSQVYTAPATGTYSVAVTQNGCNCTRIPRTVISGINEVGTAIHLAIIPNPTTRSLHIDYALGSESIISAYLSDLAGSKVLDLAIGSQGIDADVSVLSQGMYILQLVTSRGTAQAHIIKE
jgi:hypothetical protein